MRVKRNTCICNILISAFAVLVVAFVSCISDSFTAYKNVHAESGIPGDLNGDGKVNILDLTLLKLILLGRLQPNGNSDVDGNGLLNNLDSDALANSFFDKSSSSHSSGGGPTPTSTITPTSTPSPSPSPSPTPTNTTDIEASIHRGVTHLVNNQNDDGSISLNNDSTFKVWETANTIIAVHTIDKGQEEFLQKATDFLLSIRREDGSFFWRVSFEEDEYCIETTSVGTLALALNTYNISNGISFMLDLQCSNGSWEIGTPSIIDRFFPSITGFALTTLKCLAPNENLSKGIDYLKKSQLVDGSWGSSWEYYDTPFYATYPNLLALSLYGQEESDSYRKAVDYIKQNQNPEGSWGNESLNGPSKALKTSLALNSLLISPHSSDLEPIERGITWLMGNQSDDGHWDGGYFPHLSKKETIFSTDMALLALARYKYYVDGEELLCPR